MRFACTFVIFSALTFSQMAWGQAFQGSLRGRVTDPNDAVVPLAKVTLVEEGHLRLQRDRYQINRDNTRSDPQSEQVHAGGGSPRLQEAGTKKAFVIVPETAQHAGRENWRSARSPKPSNVTSEAELLNVSEASTGTDIDREKDGRPAEPRPRSVHAGAPQRRRRLDGQPQVRPHGRPERTVPDVAGRRPVGDNITLLTVSRLPTPPTAP